MKRTLTALATIALIAAPAALAEGKAYSVSDFDSIEVGAAMHVVYKSGNDTSVRVETSSGDYSDALIETRGDTLHVSRNSVSKKRGWSWFGGGQSINVSDDGKTIKVNGKKVPVYTVYVTAPDLDSVKASQSSRFTSQTINGGSIDISASSSAEIKVAGSVSEARLSASSSGELDAGGLKAGSAKISASSSGEVDAAVTGTGDTNISASSSGEVKLASAAAASFVVSASSGAGVELSGACNSISVSASSGAEVDGEGLQCKSATVNASSGADVELYATGSASGNASSGAAVSFAGKPTLQDGSKSSGGSVSFTN
jgi:hypothetical protein